MSEPVWRFGPLDGVPAIVDAPFVWYARLDDPVIAAHAGQAPLREHDLRDIARGPHAAMRGMRRRLAKLLVARAEGCHPDRVAIRHSAAGAPEAAEPAGWQLSIAGQWPHALIGLARTPIGVDIEPAGAAPPPDDTLTASEIARLSGNGRDDRLRRWLAKEAHAKRFGVARQIDPATIETYMDGVPAAAASRHGHSACHFREQDGVLACVATPR